MDRPDSVEAAAIIQRLTQRLAACIPSAGLTGAQARVRLGDLAAYAEIYLANDQAGEPLQTCFDLVRVAGASQKQFEDVRQQVEIQEHPQTLGGVLIQNACMYLCLAEQAQIIAALTFVSRQDVEALKATMRAPFDDAEELAADDMDQATYAALISLDATLTNFLVTTARPLPRMLGYQFGGPLPSLVIAYRLYSDAGRADQIIAENKVVHPAFCPALGQALSA
jgi:prophage DNA circulation protein